MLKITEPGIYDCSDDAYQSDPCEQISLRSSTAWKLVDPKSTPAHAAWECPRLNPHYAHEEKRYFNIGSACHALLFGRGKIIVPIDGYDYNRNEDGGLKAGDKREIRDLAYSEGKIPLLIPELKQVQAMRDNAVSTIEQMIEAGTIERNPFSPELSEKVIVWRDKRTGVLCRAAMDGLCLDTDALAEYKTDGQGASPDAFQWKARKLGYFFRLAFYRRGLEALGLSNSPTIRMFAQETFPPYLMALYTVDDELIAAEDEKVSRAMATWKKCLVSGFPGYDVEGYDAGLRESELQKLAIAEPKAEHVPSEHMEGYQSVGDMLRARVK